MRLINFRKSILILTAISFWSCTHSDMSNAPLIEQRARIYPDYADITVPPNIAPLNFRVDNEGDRFVINFTGENGYAFSLSTTKNVIIPIKKWRTLLNEKKMKPIRVAKTLLYSTE